MKVSKFSHVAILVKDLDKASKFFADLFGTEFQGPDENKDADTKNLLSPLGFELVTPLTPDGPVSKTLERRGEGLVMLALQVANLEEAMAAMESKGVRLLGKSETSMGMTASYHPKDLYGVMVELVERH